MKTSTINKVSMILALICFYFGLTWLFPMSHISFSPVITFESEEKEAKQFKELAESLQANDNANQAVAEGLGQPWGMQASPIAMNDKSLTYIEDQLNKALEGSTDEAVTKEIKAAKRDLAEIQKRSWKTRYTIQDYIGNIQRHVLNAMEAYDQSL